MKLKLNMACLHLNFFEPCFIFFICDDCLFYTGSQGDDNLQAMLVGAMMRKVKSRNWKKQRYFKLEDDFMTIWYQSKKTGNVRSTCKRTVIIKEPVGKWPNRPDPTVGVLLTSTCVCGSQVLGIKHADNLAQSGTIWVIHRFEFSHCFPVCCVHVIHASTMAVFSFFSPNRIWFSSIDYFAVLVFDCFLSCLCFL